MSNGDSEEWGGKVIVTSPKPFVYVAGPITANPLACVRESLPMFKKLRERGCWPYMPQWSVVAEIVEGSDYEDWLAYDFDYIIRCDALVRLPGESPGADREWEWAQLHNKATFYAGEVDGLVFANWLHGWREDNAASSPW